MRAHDEQRGPAVLRRARVLLWIQLAAGIAAFAASAGLLWIGGQATRVTAWWSAAGPLVIVAAAVALLLYLPLARRPRRGVLVAVLLLPAAFDVGDSLAGFVPDGLSERGFGWFAYTSAPAALLRFFLPLMDAALLAAMAGNLIAVANAVQLILPSARPAFRTAASDDTPPPA
ncbi:hypothetical protein LP52_10620 [Streptomonospora alba]|uniref:Uncharacterized protein n=1 Tax=Streptomonospora alba TaxID=183763 RepID=A0A0C2JIY4_9ACTN|nr:hypothetical protein [Streptomonospora alba]KIH98880.1 hypothetical protein LP52_10620 [Streptomonospora alba]